MLKTPARSPNWSDGDTLFVENLVAADTEVPHGLRDRREILGLVDKNRLLGGDVAHRFNFAIALVWEDTQAQTRQLAQEMRVDERRTKG